MIQNIGFHQFLTTTKSLADPKRGATNYHPTEDCRLMYEILTCDVKKTNFFSISGVIRDCRNLRDVRVCISWENPENVVDNDLGL